MDTSQHDESADTGSSRPADPDVVARSPARPRPNAVREPTAASTLSAAQSRTAADDEPTERLAAGDLLVGAAAIRAFLVELGMPRENRRSLLPETHRPLADRQHRRRRRKNHRQQAPAHPATLTSSRAAHLPPDPMPAAAGSGAAGVTSRSPSLRRLSPEKAAPVLKIEGSRLCWNALYIGHPSPIVNRRRRAGAQRTELPWQLMVDACTNHPGRFTSRERQFLQTMKRWRGTPTSKQLNWLVALFERVRRAA